MLTGCVPVTHNDVVTTPTSFVVDDSQCPDSFLVIRVTLFPTSAVVFRALRKHKTLLCKIGSMHVGIDQSAWHFEAVEYCGTTECIKQTRQICLLFSSAHFQAQQFCHIAIRSIDALQGSLKQLVGHMCFGLDFFHRR